MGVDEPIQEAPDELVALVATMRPTWQRPVLEQAVTTMMLDVRWSWPEVRDEVLTLACNPRRTVWDLRRVASPLADRPSVRGAAAAWAALGITREEDDGDVPEAGAA